MSASFPPYSFVPGYWPHPTRDSDGHSYNQPEETALPLNPEKWNECPSYLRGVELFNHGYYWEAHESWEGAWMALGREGDAALLLKALIKYAAVGVKIRQQASGAARSLLGQVQGHLQSLQQSIAPPLYAGLSLPGLQDDLAHLTEIIDNLSSDPELPVEIILPKGLNLQP